MDGHVVLSSLERRVDDWLYSHGVAHAYEPPLPFGSGLSGDFFAAGSYIEVWGVRNSARYDERRREKVIGYEAAGLRLVSLEPEVVEDNVMLGRALRHLLCAEYGTDPST